MFDWYYVYLMYTFDTYKLPDLNFQKILLLDSLNFLKSKTSRNLKCIEPWIINFVNPVEINKGKEKVRILPNGYCEEYNFIWDFVPYFSNKKHFFYGKISFVDFFQFIVTNARLYW